MTAGVLTQKLICVARGLSPGRIVTAKQPLAVVCPTAAAPHAVKKVARHSMA